ncbi:MAG: tRNA (guanosine(46)-N7)-methyltransferase TrmB [Spirochaetaceae bacterium]|nr:tRNA (guanosine(46)-N7)-methyltransferase TrmB [Spirochaetaceae bacterium]
MEKMEKMEKIEKTEKIKRIKSYAPRGGRMSPAQRRSYDALFPRYGIAFDPQQPVSLDPLVIEIGFGMGAATAEIALSNPAVNYLGIEVYRCGIGRLLWEIERMGLENIRIIEHDGVEVLETMIADRSVEGFHLFFPDPWPKKRHRKRRLVSRPFTDTLAAKLKAGGYLYMVTDWEDYAQSALRELSAAPGLANAYDDFAPPQAWRPCTAFEQKARAQNRPVWELFFQSKILLS